MWVRKAWVAALVFAVAGTATAQEPPHRHGKSEDGCPMSVMMMHGMGAGHGAMMGPMMRVGVFQPAHLLERKDLLGLSADQAKKLEALKASAEKAHEEAHAAAKAHHEPMMQAMGGARPNAQEMRRHFEVAHAAMGRAHWAKIDAMIQAKAVLTDVQRARVEGWADTRAQPGMGGMRPGMMGQEMMQRMMMRQGMMQGGPGCPPDRPPEP